MYHLWAVPAEFTLIHGRFGQPEKNPPERQAEIPGIFLPHESAGILRKQQGSLVAWGPVPKYTTEWGELASHL